MQGCYGVCYDLIPPPSRSSPSLFLTLFYSSHLSSPPSPLHPLSSTVPEGSKTRQRGGSRNRTTRFQRHWNPSPPHARSPGGFKGGFNGGFNRLDMYSTHTHTHTQANVPKHIFSLSLSLSLSLTHALTLTHTRTPTLPVPLPLSFSSLPPIRIQGVYLFPPLPSSYLDHLCHHLKGDV